VNDVSSRGPLRRFLNRLEVDQAVFYAICLRVWQLFAGPVSVVLIAACFTPEVQGYYYTFAALMALQSFFELGFNIVVINVSSHEWLHLKLNAQGAIVGDTASLSRLASLCRLLFRWYAVASSLFFVGVGVGGGLFLSLKDYGEISWQSPWVVLVLLSAGLLWVVPFISLLEGCGQIAVVNRYRVYQAITGNAAVWASMLLGLNLWTTVAASAARLAWDLILILVRYRRFFRTLVRSASGPCLHWRADVWPMQWRLAVSGVFSYFAFSLFTPVMFHYHGPAVAGRMGMTWQLMVMLQAVALAWVQTRVPLFGRLIAKKDFKERDRVFFRLTWISLLVVTVGATLLWLAVWALYHFDIRLATRMLSPLPTALFLLAIVALHFPHCQAFFIRAHKRELLLGSSVVSSLLIGSTVWWLGKQYGPVGAACAYLSIIVFVIFPWQTRIWWRCRTMFDAELPRG